MEINFFQNGNYYVAEFEVKTDFNLHIERDSGRKLYIYQCTSGGGDYALVNDFCNNNNQNVIDIDFTALVYPKRIKIVSDAEPTYATVVTDGEVTEIKAQSKEIEITSNGTTDITPDEGFAYLDRVSVKTNVPTSGGGGGSDWHYYDYAVVDDMEGELPSNLINYTQIAKENNVIKAPWQVVDSPQAFAVDFSAKVSVVVFIPEENKVEERLGTILEALQELEKLGGNYTLYDIPEITKEEFYRMPHNVVLEDGASEDIKIVFEDLMSKISSYPSDEKFDSPLSSYGYDSISFGGNVFTRVGKYSLNVYGGNDIIYLMISEGDNPEDGWGLYRDNTVSPKEYGLNYPG